MLERDPKPHDYEIEESGITMNYWPSLADVMSAGALVLLLFMLLSYVQAVDTADKQAMITGEIRNVLMLERRILEELEEVIADSVGKDKVALNAKDLSLNVQGEVFFDRGSFQIRPEARPLLNKLAVAFTKVLDDDRYRSHISAVLIEGHCDETGSADVNWQLSVNRAVEVVKYLHRASPKLGAEYPRYFGAAGYSKFRPPINGGIDAGMPSERSDMLARRIEIRIIPHQQIILEQVDKIITQRW